FLHGFPDAATSMVPLLKRAAANGYSAVAPFMRGYGETSDPEHGNYFVSDMARDCVEIIEALDAGEVTIVGHDWGAVAGYAAANRSPGRFSKLVSMSVPPMRVFLRNLIRIPRQFLQSWYMFFFQLPFLPEIVLKRNDFQFVETIWSQWNPDWDYPRDHLESVKEVFRSDGTPEAALSYYRALMRGILTDFRRHRKSRKLSFQKIGIPTLVMTGGEDRCVLPETFEGLERGFQGPYFFHRVGSAGHFPHLESTGEVIDRILTFLEE
ncbi:MAG: alpha/beta fold hydrolase, partial [bacterium]